MEPLLEQMRDRLAGAVEWNAQILFLENGATLPLTVTLESVRQLPHFPNSSKYNPRALFVLKPIHDSCIRFPKEGEFRMTITGRHGDTSPTPVYDRFVSMGQLRAQASIFLERRTDCMILEKSSTGSSETKFSFVASDREINGLHLQSVQLDLSVDLVQRQLCQSRIAHPA
eukprot:TRINITY_DN16970_c0_g1_i1.p1 TRINITY_DN16970_c0_g1~~TRINITY_DN16970_c0_g1_i1.p1  ORF type:complete len:171 (-),score=38.65 TRINITY_DN16970_c0_g1_i1:340-852(-)